MSRRQGFWLVLVFLLVLLGGLLVQTPAIQLMRWVQLPPGLQIQGLSGTVVDARLELLRYQQFEMRDLELEFRPGCLLRLQACYQVESKPGGLSATLAASALDQSLRVRDGRLAVPADLLRGIPQMLVQPSGDFNLNLRELVFAGQKLTALDALLTWANAGLQGEEQVLGNYSARLELTAEGLAVELDDQDSLLSLTGDALISRQGQYRVQMRMVGKPGLNRSVYSVLDMVGQRTSANNYLLNRSGRLPPQMLGPINRLLAEPPA